MAGFYRSKKRRGRPGPSKNEEKVMRREAEARREKSAARLGDLFPAVQSVSLSWKFVTPQQETYDEGARALTAADACDLVLPCPGRCRGQGAFDLTARLRSLADSGRERGEELAVCREPLYAGSPQLCDFRLECRLQVTYNPV
jgi:hypothetical protein